MHGGMGTYGVAQGPMWKVWVPKRSYGGWALVKSMGSYRLLFWEGDRGFDGVLLGLMGCKGWEDGILWGPLGFLGVG